MYLRAWQQTAFAQFDDHVRRGGSALLWEATPGAGKTVAALHAVGHYRREVERVRVMFVAPTRHLKRQWAEKARLFGLNLLHDYRAGSRLPRDYQGVVATYQQVAANRGAFADFVQGALVVSDEVHHAGGGLVWGDGLMYATQGAAFNLALSGTPFRSDDSPIPFLRYRDGVSQPDYVYSYGDAIRDRVCRPVAFFAYGGEIAWEEEGAAQYGNLAHDYDGYNRHLLVALDPDSGWVRPMFADAHDMLLTVRQEQPDAGGLIVAVDQDHARKLAEMVRDVTGEMPTVAISDNSEASQAITRFAQSDQAWLVAVRMVSEGVDIPRLRVGVYATNIRTRMFFRQFLGRVSRVTPEPAGMQVAYCYMPAIPDLMFLAVEIEEERRHVTREAGQLDLDVPSLVMVALDERTRRANPLKNWTLQSSVNRGVSAVIVNGGQLPLLPEFAQTPDVARREIQTRVEQRFSSEPNPTLAESADSLRREIKRLVGVYCSRSGRSFQDVYGQLNRMQSVRGQDDCTVAQLSERVRLVSSWL